MKGRTVGQYEIQDQLGAGGMGVVYKAHDVKLGRTVALKFLPSHLSSDENAKQRFIQEARAASALDHANICTIHDIGEDDDGQLFIVMSFYEGQTLKYRLDEGALPFNDAITIGYQIALGLATSHEAGIVHRDIKPANIMVTQKGEVKILDFGVAKLSETADLTKSGATVGTAVYMSPEQARSEPVDYRADIWSVGILLYEMLSGSRPFEGGYEAALLYSIINQDPNPLPDHLPVGIEEIVLKCLSKAPEDRYQSATDLARELEAFISSSGLMRATSTTGVREAVASSSPPSLAGVAAVFVGVSIVVLGVVYAGMIGFGLPDWVFATGIVLMVVGLPITLFAAHTERKGDGGSWLTLKKAALGGVLSMSALTIFSAAFMIMRAVGIGPAATLVTSGALEENAQLIVAEFENLTEDKTLGESVTEALRIDLSQSTAIHLMEGANIVDVLARMGREQDARIDLNTAMEIATREGAEAVVTGEIRPVGRGFVLSARLLAATDGAELVAIRENAKDDGAIIDAIDRLSERLREAIGESIKTIRANKNLDYVSTTSLEALRYYSEAKVAFDRGQLERARDLLLDAIELDSSFAMAYRKLGATYSNMGAPAHLQVEAITRAYELRDRLPARERWAAIAFYFARVDRNNEREIAAYESLLEQYPDDMPGLNNLALLYNVRGDSEKAVPLLRHALEVADGQSFYDNLLDALTNLKKWDEVSELLNQFEANQPDHPARYYFRFFEAMASRNYESADTLLKSTSLSDAPVWHITDEVLKARYYGFRGRFDEAEARNRRSADLNMARGSPDAALVNYLDIAFNYLDRQGKPNDARRVLEEGLLRVPLDSIPPISRPYSDIIGLLAKLGDLERANALRVEYEAVVPIEVQRSDFRRWEAIASISMTEGQPHEALTSLRQLELEDHCGICSVYDEARVLEQIDSLDQAIEVHLAQTNNSFASIYWFWGEEIPVSHFRLGELYSERGDIDEAIENYSKFVDMWQDADADVQPQVQYARDRIDALLTQKAREPQ